MEGRAPASLGLTLGTPRRSLGVAELRSQRDNQSRDETMLQAIALSVDLIIIESSL